MYKGLVIVYTLTSSNLKENVNKDVVFKCTLGLTKVCFYLFVNGPTNYLGTLNESCIKYCSYI